jgi:hypothetical protein
MIWDVRREQSRELGNDAEKRNAVKKGFQAWCGENLEEHERSRTGDHPEECGAAKETVLGNYRTSFAITPNNRERENGDEKGSKAGKEAKQRKDSAHCHQLGSWRNKGDLLTWRRRSYRSRARSWAA